MYYVCVEEKQIRSILNYQPAAPKSVTVYEITDDEYSAIRDGSHYFDVEAGKVQSLSTELAERREMILAKQKGRLYLQETDWKVMRHIREKALGLPLSMTFEEYIALERKRHEVAEGI